MRKLLVAVSVLIIYGSLYPFNFNPEAYDSSLLPGLFYFGLEGVGRGDFVSNVLLFVPFGFLAMQSAGGQHGWKAWVLILLGAFIIAHGVQVAQIFVPGRIPSGSDTTLNLLGCVLGCLLGMLRAPRVQGSPGKSAELLPAPILLAVFLILWNLRPFIPSLDLQLLINNLKYLLAAPVPHPVWTFQGLVTWLIIFHFLEAGDVKLIPEKYYPALVLVTLALGFFIIGNSMTVDRIAGALLALPLWLGLRRLPRPPILALLTFALIVGISFTPFELRGGAHRFNWVPFSGALDGNVFIAVLATTKKALLYGSLIYLLIEMNLRFKTATLIVTGFLFISELLQVFFTNTTPEITDSLLALMSGIGLYLWEDYRKRSGSMEAPGESAFPTVRESVPGRSQAVKSSPPVTTLPEKAQPERIPAMDGLRAIAALAVFFVHFNQQAGLQALAGPFDLDRFLANGNTGVALFFTLSGLLLSIPFWQANLSKGEFPNIKSYAWRRAARIIPAYYFCLFSILLVTSVAGSGTSWGNIVSHILFIFNVDDRHILSLNQPFWTLAVEVQFYILLPFLFLAFRKTTGNTTFWLILGLVPLLYFANFILVESLEDRSGWPIHQALIWPLSIHLSGPDSFVLTYSTLAHLPHFLMGVLGARIFLLLSDVRANANQLKSRCEIIFWLSSLCIVLILATPLDDLLQIPLGRYNFPFVPLLLVAVVVSLPFTGKARHILDLSWISWLGCVSYGIYIYHYPVQKLISHLMSMADLRVIEYPVAFGFISLSVTLMSAQFSYRWLEAPVMRWIRRKLDGPVSMTVMEEGSGGAFTNSYTGLDASGKPRELQIETFSENSDTPQQDQGAPGSRRELLLNLHSSQAKFVQLLAAVTDLEPSEVCQRLIDLNMRPGADWRNDPIYSVAVQNGLKSFTRDPADRNWVQFPIDLDITHFEALGALAESLGQSPSKTMRHFVADCMNKSGISPRRHGNTRHSHSKLRVLLKSRSYAAIASVSLLALVVVTLLFVLQDGRSIKTGPHWAGNPATVIIDPHMHTRYSDGALSPAKLVDMAVENGCDALAISDHSDTPGTVSDRQMLELQSLRGKYPDLLLFSGIELNMPSYGEREHATLIADPSVENATLQQLRDVAESSRKMAKQGYASRAADRQLLQMIADYQSRRNSLALIYNHPARKDADIRENLTDLTQWNSRSSVFTVIEGAPGHQNDRVIGSYKKPYLTEDRWDPVVAQVGGIWDELLSGGHQLWGALATSDYHNSKLDKPPCAFSRTHLMVPERSYRGVLKALKMGTFWADHGRILDQLQFAVDVDGIEETAFPGYIVHVGDRDSLAQVTLSVERGPGSVGQPLTMELIGDCVSGDAKVLVEEEIPADRSSLSTLIPLAATGRDGESCTLRVRVRLKQNSDTDYLAYTNPIRLILD